ncbi:MAG TPA: hypothetical protein VHM89_08015, partial [Acidimicrobiales bacterium]|nr:hypothetical protein [Acidimicrobiales bacterium]
MDGDPRPDKRMAASPMYALGRLQRAIETASNHPDPETRQRGEAKALAWEAILSAMSAGTLDVGSRTPVANTPAWVTLEVAHGGFATGRYVAEGPLDDDEQRLLERLPLAGNASDRARLNTWFLSDEGLAHLSAMLERGQYAVDAPEHGALLIAAWLVDNGQDSLALDVVAELYPLIDRLRFYPVETDRPPTSGAVVHLRSAGEVSAQLTRVTVPPQVAAMNEAIRTWLPLYDRLTALWLDTVRDDWPCRSWPDDWAERRARWLADFETAEGAAPLCGEHRKPRSTLFILREALERCEADSIALSGRDVGRVRMALRRSVARWGDPASLQRAALRSKQNEWASRPTHKQVADVLVERLAAVPQNAGIADLEPFVVPVHVSDPTERDLSVPDSFVRKVERALEAPIEELIERRVVPSSEVLADVLPQITSHVAAGAFDDAKLRELYARIYAAFRHRRSLLLLNLEHQVQIDELPWVKAIEPFRQRNADTRVKARDTLRHATLLAFSSFPQTILPNPLVSELTALAKQAELNLPLVEEVAADIFMGTFTLKWREAAAIASDLMAGTLYARYYDLPITAAWPPLDNRTPGLAERVKTRWGKKTAVDFAQVCSERSREAALGDGSFVARNGTLIEQSQILTTHNLAQLVDRLAITGRVTDSGAEWAAAAFAWIV